MARSIKEKSPNFFLLRLFFFFCYIFFLGSEVLIIPSGSIFFWAQDVVRVCFCGLEGVLSLGIGIQGLVILLTIRFQTLRWGEVYHETTLIILP